MTDYNSAFSSHNKSEGLAGFDAARPAPEYTPLPPGVYTGRIVKGEYVATRSGADAYRMTFEVIDSPHAGRTLIRTWTFTPKALPYTKRDLSAFGLATSQQLLSPFPPPGREYFVRLIVALQRLDDGRECNDVKRVEVLRVAESPIAPFIVGQTGEEGTV